MKISIKAIFIGFLIAMAGGIAIAVFTMLLYVKLENSMPDHQTEIWYITEAIRIAALLLAGYAAAKIAKRNEIIHGSIVGFFTWSMGSAMVYFSIKFQKIDPGNDFFDVESLIGLLINTGTCALGAFIRKKLVEKRNLETTPSLEQKIENPGHD